VLKKEKKKKMEEPRKEKVTKFRKSFFPSPVFCSAFLLRFAQFSAENSVTTFSLIILCFHCIIYCLEVCYAGNNRPTEPNIVYSKYQRSMHIRVQVPQLLQTYLGEQQTIEDIFQ
jgi:Pyruvate/2-oxoacid:ferredoxin oxidoreductase delta subunit